MNNDVRRGVDVAVALKSSLQSRLGTFADLGMDAPAPQEVLAPPAHRGRRATAAFATRWLRPPIARLYRAVKPVLRPLAVRARAFLLGPLDSRWQQTAESLESLRLAQEVLHTELARSYAAMLKDVDAARDSLRADVRSLEQAVHRVLDLAATIDESRHRARLDALHQALSMLAAPFERLDATLAAGAETARQQASALHERLASYLDGRTNEAHELIARDLSVLHESIAREAERQHGEALRQVQDVLSRLARVEAYAEAAARRVAAPAGAEEVLVRTTVGYVLCPADDPALLAVLLDTGEVERGIRLVIERILQIGDTFVDVGANVGLHTLAACRRIGPRGRVVAFEPYERTARLLESTVWINGFSGMVTVHRAAAGDQPERRPLFLGRTSGHHSLFPGLHGGAAPALVEVTVVTLDEVLAGQQPTVVKIDVEGAEVEVLEGAKTLIERTPDVGLVVEFGGVHLQRRGMSPARWMAAFESCGLVYRRIDDDTGALSVCTLADLLAAESANLLWARPASAVWRRAAEQAR